jgi:FMN phosphatase YigB (HAD superfamily)
MKRKKRRLMGTLWRPVGCPHSSVLDQRRSGQDAVSSNHPIIFLVDVDNTLLDNDAIQEDLKDHLERAFGLAARERYWGILEDLFAELGYRDYLGALQRYRGEHPRDVELLSMSSFLIDYPFADRRFPAALEVLKRLRSFGPAVILSDGDVVFQPRKIEHAGLSDAVDGRVLIYVHKEEALDDVERRYPAAHYVIVDDKLRILTAVKQYWGTRVTTVFVRQGTYAHDPKVVGASPSADVTIERIGDLLGCDLPRMWSMAPVCASTLESTQ